MKKLYIPLIIITTIIISLLIYSKYINKQTFDIPLKQLASQHNLELGNFAIYNHIYEEEYKEILTTQFDFVLIDNTPNWSFTDGGLRPTKDTYNFEQMDNIVKYAKEYDMPIEAHHLVWGDEKWLPDWLKEGEYTPEELKEIIREHILTVGSHYKGEIRQWSVVNEAFTRNLHHYDLRDWWGDNIGDISYIDDAFIWAREADPDAILILNDFRNDTKNDVSDMMYEYIKDARERGVPIDGIGMQMHIDGSNPPKKKDVIENMQRFAELGIGVYVTEFDVNMNDVKGTRERKERIQGRVYYEMLRACIESEVCHNFAYLGITDAETWYNYMELENDPMPLMYDRNYNPKPAYYSTYKALLKNL